MTASNQVFLVMDAGTPVAAFTVKRDMQVYLRRKLDTFCNPLVYTFQDGGDAQCIRQERSCSRSFY